jgi:hypothetical protein
MRSKLKRIVISEHNYLALKRLGYAGDSFNVVISKLLRIERSYQEMKKQQQQEQQKSDDENNNASSIGPPFPGSLSELFEEHDSFADIAGMFEAKIRLTCIRVPC